MTVPEDRGDPDGRQVTLAVAVFPATGETADAPPLIYLEGGPGAELLEVVPFAFEPLFSDLNVGRTIVLFDQRGTGFSDPALVCPELRELGFEILDDIIEVDELTNLRLAALRPCQARWESAGIDLSQYNSADSASDVADLRLALGYPEWDLYGVSYGTRLALTVMRDHPEGVRAVVLDSTYPPEVDGVGFIPASAHRALGQLFEACSSDHACTEAYGDVETLLFGLVDDLNEMPVMIRVSDLFTGIRYDAVVDGDAILDLVFQSLYSEDLLFEIPEMLTDVRDGRFEKIETLTSLIIATEEFFAIGQNFSVQCHEEVPFSDPAIVRNAMEEYPRLASLVSGAFTQSSYAFEFWGAGVGAPIEADPVLSGIPTLVVGGQFDPITPPALGMAVAERLERGFFVEFPGLGHGVATVQGCPLSITLAFLADPQAEPVTSCVGDMIPAQFTVFRIKNDIELVEAEVDIFGDVARVNVPRGWEDAGHGRFYRSPAGTDPTVLMVQAIPRYGLVDDLLGLFAGEYSDDGSLDEVAPLTIGGREWRRFSEPYRGLVVEIAYYEDLSESIIIGLVSDSREAAYLLEAVFFPALESVLRVAD